MHILNNRYGRLLSYLFSQNKRTSLEEIAKGIDASKSTAWRDIAFLESVLPSEWKIEKDEFSGVYLEKPHDGTLEKLWSEVRKHCSYFQTLKLIFLNKGITLSQLSAHFHISRSTVYRQLEVIHQVVERAGIKLTPSPYKLIGDEKKIRAFYMQFWELVDDDTRSMIEFHESIDSTKFQKDLMQILSKYAMILHTGAFQRLMAALSISNMRIAQGNYVSFPIKAIAASKESTHFKVMNKLFQYQYVKQCPNQETQLQEVLYLALHLMSEEKSLSRSRELYIYRNKMKKIDGYLLPHLLKRLSDQVGFDLTDDDIFLSHMLQISKKISIASHFEIDTEARGIIQYLQHVESHPLFQYVEEVIASASSNMLEGVIRKGHSLNIFFLLQAAILRRRNSCSIRIALIGCTFVEMDYIYEVLNYHLGNRAIIAPLDDADFETINCHNQFDLLIATSLVDVSRVKHIPVIKVSSVPTNSELLRVENIVEKHFSDVLGLDKEMICTFSTLVNLGKH